MSTQPETTERPPVHVWRRRFIIAGVLTLYMIAFAAVRWADERHRTADALKALVARLDAEDPGWRLDDIEAARADPPPGHNSDDVIIAVAKLMPRYWPYYAAINWSYADGQFDRASRPELRDAEKAMVLADGEARLTPLVSGAAHPAGQAGQLADEMARMAPALAQARRLADMPDGRHKRKFGLHVGSVLFTYGEDRRRAAALLRYDAWDLAQRGDTKGALLADRACVNAGRSVGDEPTEYAHQTRIACVEWGLKSVARTLAVGEASDADLAELQGLLRLEERHPTLRIVMRGQRALQHALHESIRPGLNLPRRHLLALEALNDMVAAAELPPHEQAAAENALKARADALARSDAYLKNILLPLTSLCAAHRLKLGGVRAMDALLAAERYRLKSGGWPARLEDIPREMLPSVPPDPYDGKPVRYRRTADGVVAYVLWDNLKDDGGDVTPSHDSWPRDWGYRLWDVSKRRQTTPPPAPKPADGAQEPGQ